MYFRPGARILIEIDRSGVRRRPYVQVCRLFAERVQFIFLNRSSDPSLVTPMQNQPKTAAHMEPDLLGRALTALAKQTGLQAEVTAREHAVEIRWEGRQYEYLVEAKTNTDRATTLANAKRQLQDYGERGLLVTEYMTPALATRCREELDLQFIDTAGNAYLRRPGLYVFIKGERPTEIGTMPGTRGAGTMTALRVTFTLLCNPDLLNAPYRDIVNAAGVALGTVGWVFLDLERRGLIIGEKGGRRLVDRERLIDEWATTYAMKLRPKLNPQRFRTETAGWWQNLNLRDVRAKWGGEVAADRLTNNLTPKAYTIYADREYRAELLQDLVGRLQVRLRADPKGDIEILDRFWKLPETTANTDCAPPLLVYADLMATLEPRNIEVAQTIRQKLLRNAED